MYIIYVKKLQIYVAKLQEISYMVNRYYSTWGPSLWRPSRELVACSTEFAAEAAYVKVDHSSELRASENWIAVRQENLLLFGWRHLIHAHYRRYGLHQ